MNKYYSHKIKITSGNIQIRNNLVVSHKYALVYAKSCVQALNICFLRAQPEIMLVSYTEVGVETQTVAGRYSPVCVFILNLCFKTKKDFLRYKIKNPDYAKDIGTVLDARATKIKPEHQDDLGDSDVL